MIRNLYKISLIFLALFFIKCKTEETSVKKSYWIVKETEINGIKKAYDINSEKSSEFVLLRINKITKSKSLKHFEISGAETFNGQRFEYNTHYYRYRKIKCNASGIKQWQSFCQSKCCSRALKNEHLFNDFIEHKPWEMKYYKDSIVFKNDSIKYAFIPQDEFFKKWKEYKELKKK